MTSLKAWEIFLHFFPPLPSLHTLALSVLFDVHSAAPGIRRGGSLQLKMTKPKIEVRFSSSGNGSGGSSTGKTGRREAFYSLVVLLNVARR